MSVLHSLYSIYVYIPRIPCDVTILCQQVSGPVSETNLAWRWRTKALAIRQHQCSENRSRCIIKRRVRLPFGQHFGRGGGGRGGSGCLPWISGSAQWKRFRWFHVMCSVNDLLVTIIPLILSEASPYLKLEIFGNPYLHLPELYTVHAQCNLRKGILLKLNMFLVPLWPIQCGATLGLLS